MSGIVNTTGAVSGVIGTTVGTPDPASVLQVVSASSTTVHTTSGSNVEGSLAVADTITTTVLNSKIFMTSTSYLNPTSAESSVLAFFRNDGGTRTLIFACSTSDRLSPLDGWYGESGSLRHASSSYLWSPSLASGTALTIEARGLCYRTDAITTGFAHPTHKDAESTIILMEVAP